MNFTYTTVDGERVERNVAAAFHRMAADFRRDTGCTLHVLSGTRTDAEQEAIFRARYRVQATGGGRFNDVRWWQGKRWVRHSAAGTVAVPGTSNHQANGPNGPRSIDIYDSGKDAGVTVRGTARDLWMERNAGTYGFENEGYSFGEPWHKTFRGSIGGSPTPAGGGASVAVPSTTTIQEEEETMNSGVYYDSGSNTTTYLIFNAQSGWYHEFSNGTGRGPMPPAYNNALAAALGTPTWAKVTRSHADVIKRSLDGVRRNQVSGSLSVNVDVDG